MHFVQKVLYFDPHFQSKVRHPALIVARTEMRAGCPEKIALRSRMKTASVPSELTLRDAVGDFKPQLIVIQRYPLQEGRTAGGEPE